MSERHLISAEVYIKTPKKLFLTFLSPKNLGRGFSAKNHRILLDFDTFFSQNLWVAFLTWKMDKSVWNLIHCFLGNFFNCQKSRGIFFRRRFWKSSFYFKVSFNFWFKKIFLCSQIILVFSFRMSKWSCLRHYGGKLLSFFF